MGVILLLVAGADLRPISKLKPPRIKTRIELVASDLFLSASACAFTNNNGPSGVSPASGCSLADALFDNLQITDATHDPLLLVLALPQLDDSRHRVALHLPMQTDIGVRPVATTARHATALLRAATNTARHSRRCNLAYRIPQMPLRVGARLSELSPA